MRKEIFERIVEILESKGFDRINIKNETKLTEGDLCLSSLDAIDLIVRIEECFGIEFPEEYLNLTFLDDIDSLVDVIEKLI